MQQETKFKLKVKKDLEKLKNIWFYKTQEVARHGIPDYILCLNSLFIAIELKKSKKDKPDLLQTHNLKQIKWKAKGMGLYAHPENWQLLYKVLQEIDKASFESSHAESLCAVLRSLL